MGWSSIDIKERFQWTFPIVFSPTDPKVLYASSQHLWRTTNGGQSWEKISPNLTRSDPKTMQASGGPITKDQTGVETYAVIFTIAPSRQDGNTIWTGSDDGWVHVTRDGGKNWERVTPPDLPDFTRISLIEASPHQNGVAYLAGNRYQQGDRRPYFYKTTDFGKTWTKIVTGIPDERLRARDSRGPKRRGLLYAGTEHGIYISFNDGASWQSLRLNLPVTPVHGIVSEERDLVIGTHGRGFYILDDINVLRQAAGDITSAARCTSSSPTIRCAACDNNIAIDYFLGKDADEVKIEIPRRQRARCCAPSPGPPKDPAARRRRGRRWRRRRFRRWRRAARRHAQGHESLHLGSAAGGRRRVSRDDHVGGAAAARSGVAAGEIRRAHHAPTARPRAATSPSASIRGCRADGITEAYLHEQFKLSTQVRDRVTEANTAVIKIRAIRDQVNERTEEGARAAPRRDPENRRRRC